MVVMKKNNNGIIVVLSFIVVVVELFVSLLQLIIVVHASTTTTIKSAAFVMVERKRRYPEPPPTQSTYDYTSTATRRTSSSSSRYNTVLFERKKNPNNMKRPFFDQLATTIFQLETKRVESSSVYDDQGRYGEPMEWSNATSLANQFSVMIASNPIGYTFKQTVANLVAGNYNEDEVTIKINQYIQQDTVVMFSFTTCPFCRKAKDILDERNIKYTAIELDTISDGGENNNNNEGNIIRAQLGKLTKRTSMPNIFIRGKCIGGCNDGYPGLIPLIEQNQLDNALLSL